MGEKIEDLEQNDLNKALEQEEIEEREQEKSLAEEEKSEELDAKGERVKAMLRKKKLEEMASKYTDTLYDNLNKHIKEIDKDIKPEVIKKPNIIKRFFNFIKRLFGGNKKSNIVKLKDIESKNIDSIEVKKQTQASLEDIDRYNKEINVELQQAVERDRVKREQKIEEIKDKQENRDIQPKL